MFCMSHNTSDRFPDAVQVCYVRVGQADLGENLFNLSVAVVSKLQCWGGGDDEDEEEEEDKWGHHDSTAYRADMIIVKCNAFLKRSMFG